MRNDFLAEIFFPFFRFFFDAMFIPIHLSVTCGVRAVAFETAATQTQYLDIQTE